MALTKPFAVNGDKTPIELDTTSDGVVNYENGFGARYSMPIKAVIDSSGNITKTGGLQIERAQMNQILNDFSSAIIENQENIGDLSSLQTTAKDNLVNVINEVNNVTPKLLTQNLTWTVGTGGDFTDLQSAINEAAKYIPCSTGVRISLRLISNLNINNTITLSGLNLQYVDIHFNNFKIIYNGVGDCMVLSYSTLGRLLYLNIESNDGGIVLLYSKIMLILGETSIRAKTLCINIAQTSSLYFHNSNLNLHSLTNVNISCNSGSICSFRLVNRTLTSTSGSVVFSVADGGIVSFNGNENIGSIPFGNIAINTLTPNGIIFKR